jgi:putative transposase
MAASLDIAALPADPALLRALLVEALAERDDARAARDALEAQNDRLRHILWLEQNEGAKCWLRVMNELRHRGLEDILLAVVDGPKGSPDAIRAVFPEAMVQTCTVHLLRHSLDFVSWKDRKLVAAALKDIARSAGCRS